MDERWWKALYLVIPVALAFAAAWGYAAYDLRDRISTFASEVHDHDISLVRGAVGVPSDEVLEERVRESADELGIELQDLSIETEILESEEDFQGENRAVRFVRDGLAQTGTRDVEVDDEHGTVTVTREAHQMTSLYVWIGATVRAEKWLWSREDHVEVEKTIAPRLR